jgi:hypothetical protein
MIGKTNQKQIRDNAPTPRTHIDVRHAVRERNTHDCDSPAWPPSRWLPPLVVGYGLIASGLSALTGSG